VIDRQVLALLEGQPVELVGRVEDALLQDAVELEVGAELRLVEGVLLLADLLGVVGPVPGRELEALLLLRPSARGSMIFCISAASRRALATAAGAIFASMSFTALGDLAVSSSRM
jgi:hypothetical protein